MITFLIFRTTAIQEEAASCTNFVSLVIICTLFLLAQLVLLFAWALLWQRRAAQRAQSQKHLLQADTRSLCSSSGSALPAYAAPFSQLLYGNAAVNAAQVSPHYGGSMNKKPLKCSSPCSTLSSTLSSSRRAHALDTRFHVNGVTVAGHASPEHYGHGMNMFGSNGSRN